MLQGLQYAVISNATVSRATAWLLTSTGVFTNTQTITIGGVVFTTVTALSVGPAVAGEVLIGADASTTLTNLVAAINAPSTTTSTFTALSATNADLLRSYKFTATKTSATLMTLTTTGTLPVTVSETQTNANWTVNYTSLAIPTNAFGKTALQFIAASVSSGNGVFTVDISNDGTNWIAYNRLNSNVTNTNAQTDTRVASVTLSSSTNAMVTFPADDCPAFFRVKVIPTTDGTYSATAYVI